MVLQRIPINHVWVHYVVLQRIPNNYVWVHYVVLYGILNNHVCVHYVVLQWILNVRIWVHYVCSVAGNSRRPCLGALQYVRVVLQGIPSAYLRQFVPI